MILRSLDEDDWGKLKQGLKYLKVTLYMKLYIRDYSLNIVHWCVDALYDTHWDCKSHTLAVIPMGAGAIMSFSRKHNLNNGSSTEAELVGIADSLGLMICTKYFMEAQGYSIDSNILFQ